VLHDVFGSDDHAVQLLTVTARARALAHVGGGRRDARPRRKISEVWISVRDPYALDEFLNSLAEG